MQEIAHIRMDRDLETNLDHALIARTGAKLLGVLKAIDKQRPSRICVDNSDVLLRVSGPDRIALLAQIATFATHHELDIRECTSQTVAGFVSILMRAHGEPGNMGDALYNFSSLANELDQFRVSKAFGKSPIREQIREDGVYRAASCIVPVQRPTRHERFLRFSFTSEDSRGLLADTTTLLASHGLNIVFYVGRECTSTSVAKEPRFTQEIEARVNNRFDLNQLRVELGALATDYTFSKFEIQ